MNNLPADNKPARLELKYKIEAPADQGDSKLLLGTALELEHVAGITPHSIEYITYTEDGPVYEFVHYSPADIRKLQAGKMSEIEYFAKNRLTKP